MSKMLTSSQNNIYIIPLIGLSKIPIYIRGTYWTELFVKYIVDPIQLPNLNRNIIYNDGIQQRTLFTSTSIHQ